MRTSETRFRVIGIKCGGCVVRAREALGKVAGVTSAEFDLKTGSTVVSGTVEPQAVIRALSEAGYPAAVETE